MIDDVARLAAHSRLREETIARICQELIETAGLAGESERALADVAAHCGERALLWATRAPDAAYVAVGRPAATGEADARDAVLEELASVDRADVSSRLGMLLRSLDDVAATYDAQHAAVDGRLDPPTAGVLAACRASITADRHAAARLAV